MMITSTAVRISRRGFRPTQSISHLSVEMPCLHPDIDPRDDTGR